MTKKQLLRKIQGVDKKIKKEEIRQIHALTKSFNDFINKEKHNE